MKPFHQIVRYEIARCAIEAMRSQKCHKVLEVGSGSHANLADYLFNDNITFLDNVLSEDAQADPRFILGDALSMNFANEDFDFVIALDVLEHIQPSKRERFLEEICRVAKRGVVLTFPHDTESDSMPDEKLKSFYVAAESDPPIWIDEHIDCTLPKTQEICEKIKDIAGVLDIYSIYGVRRSLMQMMLQVEAASSRNPQVLNYFQVLNATYINDIMYHDLGEEKQESEKSYIFISKKEDLSCIKDRLSQQFIPDKIIIDKFEKEVERQVPLYFHLEEVASDRKTVEAVDALKSKFDSGFEQIFLNFEVLNGRNSLAQNDLQERIKEQHANNIETLQQVSQNIMDGISNLRDCLAPFHNVNVVNVILITYNQSKYIEDTVKSLLAQKTKFQFNVLVADDCSQDDTVEKIHRLAEQTNIQFVFLDSEKNLGIMHNYQRAFAACDAEYVAILEGDDLWTDPLRLQKHIDFLQEHSECAMSFNRYIVKDFDKGEFHMQPRFAGEEEKHPYRYISGHDLAYDNLIGNFSTCVYRRSCLVALPDQLFDMQAYDWLTNILISRMGYIGCLMQATSIYRIHAKGVWSGLAEEKRLQDLISAIDLYNEYTNFEFADGFNAHRERIAAHLAELQIAQKIEEILPPVMEQSKFKHKVKQGLKKLYNIRNYIPPIMTYFVKLIIPQTVQNRLREKLR